MFCCASIFAMHCAIGQDTKPDTARMAALRVEARAFEHGEGVPRNSAQAVSLYCQAARQGDAEAQFGLGWMYANGRGIARDDDMAAYFFSLAAQQGHQHAQVMLRFVGAPRQTTPDCMRDLAAEAETVRAEQRRMLALLLQRETLNAATPAQRRVMELLFRLAPDYGVDPLLGLAVVRFESNFDPAAVSPKNAQGLMQLIPETSARFNVTKPFDPEQNIRGGLSYLRWLLAYFKGNVALVAAAYNAGEGAVNRYKGIPPYAETQDYVKRIMGAFKKDEHPYDASIVQPSPELAAMRVRVKL